MLFKYQLYKEVIWTDTSTSPTQHFFTSLSLSLSLLGNLLSPLPNPSLGSRKSSKYDGWRQHLIRCLHRFKNIDFLVLKLSETVRLFRAEVRPGPSHSLLTGGGSAACSKGDKGCGKAHCSFSVFCSNFESPIPKSLEQGCWGAKTMCVACRNLPVCNRWPGSNPSQYGSSVLSLSSTAVNNVRGRNLWLGSTQIELLK